MKRLIIVSCILVFSAIAMAQSFTFTASQTSVSDTAGHFFDIYADLTNTSGQELSLRVIRTRSDLPADPGWFNSLCNGVICYAPFVDTINVPDAFFGIPALGVDSTMEFHINVGSDDFVPGVAYINVRAENVADTSDNVELAFMITTLATAIEDNDILQPKEFTLLQNYPNPFNPETTIEFELSVASLVTLEIFDNLGKRIAVEAYHDTPLQAGTQKYIWDATDANGNQVTSGVYFYRLQVDKVVKTRKMLLVR